MPKTMLMLAFACLLAHGAGAQTSEPYLHHNPNDTTLVFGDNVNLRAAPKKDAAVVGRLHAGQKVKIVAQTNELLTLDGRTEYWFEVAPLGQDVRGFMWGGLLAWAWADTAGLCFALNVVSDKKEGPGLEFRAIRDGQVLSSAVFYEYFIGYDNQVYRPSLVVSGNHGLAGFEHVISLNMDIPTEVCWSNLELYLLWDGARLVSLPALHNGADAPVYASQSYLFPDDPEGVKDAILVVFESGEMEIDDDEVQSDKMIRVRRVQWDGQKFVLPKLTAHDED